MIEVRKHIDEDVIFHENCESESHTRKLGGVPTAIDYENGIAKGNGTTSQITHGNKFTLQVTDAFSIVCKIKFNDLTDGSMFMKASYTSYDSGFYFAMTNSGLLQLNFFGSTGARLGKYTTNRVTTGSFLYVICTYTGSQHSDGVKIYINKNECSYQAASNSVIDTIVSNNPVRLFATNVDRFLNAEYDSIKVYKRALTQEEINNIVDSNTYRALPSKTSNYEEVLNIDNRLGLIQDKYGNTITNNNVTIPKWSKVFVEYYNGTNSYLSCGNVGTINSISLWVKLNSLTETILDLDGGTNKVTVTAGTLSYWGNDCYVDTANADTITLGWHLITIVDNTGTAASALKFGYDGSNYYKGCQGIKIARTGVITLQEHVQLYTSQKHLYR